MAFPTPKRANLPGISRWNSDGHPSNCQGQGRSPPLRVATTPAACRWKVPSQCHSEWFLEKFGWWNFRFVMGFFMGPMGFHGISWDFMENLYSKSWALNWMLWAKVQSWWFHEFHGSWIFKQPKNAENTKQIVNSYIMFPHFLVQNCFMFSVRESIVVHAVGPSCRQTRLVKVEDFFQQRVAKLVRKKWEGIPGWWFEPLWKIWKSIGMIIYSQYLEK